MVKTTPNQQTNKKQKVYITLCPSTDFRTPRDPQEPRDRLRKAPPNQQTYEKNNNNKKKWFISLSVKLGVKTCSSTDPRTPDPGTRVLGTDFAKPRQTNTKDGLYILLSVKLGVKTSLATHPVPRSPEPDPGTFYESIKCGGKCFNQTQL